MSGAQTPPEQTRAIHTEFAEALEQEFARLSAEIGLLGDAGRQLAIGQADEGRAGSEDADVASDLAEAELDLGLQRSQLVRLSQVKAAQQRLQNGTYGTCVRCNSPIELDRLRRLPWTESCSTCARKASSFPNEA